MGETAVNKWESEGLMAGTADLIYKYSPVAIQHLMVSTYGLYWNRLRFGVSSTPNTAVSASVRAIPGPGHGESPTAREGVARDDLHSLLIDGRPARNHRGAMHQRLYGHTGSHLLASGRIAALIGAVRDTLLRSGGRQLPDASRYLQRAYGRGKPGKQRAISSFQLVSTASLFLCIPSPPRDSAQLP